MKALKTIKPECFSAKICKVGINPCVEVPRRVSGAFGKRGYVPVKGMLNGHAVRATLVPVGKGRHRFFVNGAMRKAAGVDVGDRVELVLEMDTGSREVPMPDAFARALKKDPVAHAAFLRMPPSHQKEYLVYMNSLKKSETLERVIRRALAQLLEKS